MEAVDLASWDVSRRIGYFHKGSKVIGGGCLDRYRSTPIARGMVLALVWLPVLILAIPTPAGPRSVPVIFDTDIGNDVDDALALGMLHALESRGEVKILAVTITKDNKWAAPFVNVVNTFYGRPGIPIGVVKGGKAQEDSAMIKEPCERKRADGSPVYPHELTDGTAAPDALTVLRAALAREQDQSVVIIQVGFSTNLARLLDTAGDAASPLAGKALVARKVRLLSCMAGAYPTGIPEYNVRTDLPAARKLFAEWPTPIVASGFEVGQSILYPAVSIERDFGYVTDHPIAEAYRNYKKMPYDRPTWDLTSVLYAVRPDRGYFDLSPPGKIMVGDDSVTRFEASDRGNHKYLIASESQRQRALEAMIYLASQPPGGRN